jgi:hypothetical protein
VGTTLPDGREQKLVREFVRGIVTHAARRLTACSSYKHLTYPNLAYCSEPLPPSSSCGANQLMKSTKLSSGGLWLDEIEHDGVDDRSNN